ncbi:MAG: class I SAM-dependent methyltransferase [Egibacteraceae bacterium]
MIRSAVDILRRVDARLFSRFAQQYEMALEREIIGGCESLLDLGCGADSPIRRFAHRLTYSVGIDAFDRSLSRSRVSGIHTDYASMDVLRIEGEFAPKSFDCVVALDLIEHLEKDDGLRLIQAMEAIARNKVVVFTPNGFLPQAAYENNELQEHLSGWDTSEMSARGYRVVGINGWKPLRGEYAEIVWWPQPFWTRISYLTQGWVESRPEWAFQILCVKDVTAGRTMPTKEVTNRRRPRRRSRICGGKVGNP